VEDKEELGPLAVIPLLNPDGYARDSRYNARGVDLNRNLPAEWAPETDEPSGPEPLSEIETKLLHAVLLESRPARIVSLHWALGELDPDGEGSRELAAGMWECLGDAQKKLFRLREPGAASRPGSLGSFCRIAAPGWVPSLVTLELPYHPDPAPSPSVEERMEQVRLFWRKERERYWNTVYPAVESMLRFAAGA
jgi:hypothetical protein